MDANNYQQSSAVIEALFADAIARVKAQAAQTMAGQKEKSEAQAQQAIAKIRLESETAIAEEKVKAKKAAGWITKIEIEAEEKAKAIADEVAQLKAELTEKEKACAEQIDKIRTEADEAITRQKTESESQFRDKGKDYDQRISQIKAEADKKVEDLTEQIARLEAEAEEKQKTHAEEIADVNAEKEEAIANIKAEYEGRIAKAKAEIEEKVQELERTAKEKVEEKTETEAEAKGRAKTDDTGASASDSAIEEKPVVMAENKQSATGEVSKAIRKMVESSAALPGKKPVMSSGLCARDIMQKELVWASPEDSIQQTLAKMRQCNIGYILVSQNGTLKGIVSKSDLTSAVSPYLRPEFAKWRRPLDDATLQIRVKWIMRKPTRIIGPQTPLVDIVRNMCKFGFHALPVVNEQAKMQGLLTEVNIFKAILKLIDSQNLSTHEKTHQKQPASGHPAVSKSTQTATETI